MGVSIWYSNGQFSKDMPTVSLNFNLYLKISGGERSRFFSCFDKDNAFLRRFDKDHAVVVANTFFNQLFSSLKHEFVISNLFFDNFKDPPYFFDEPH